MFRTELIKITSVKEGELYLLRVNNSSQIIINMKLDDINLISFFKSDDFELCMVVEDSNKVTDTILKIVPIFGLESEEIIESIEATDSPGLVRISLANGEVFSYPYIISDNLGFFTFDDVTFHIRAEKCSLEHITGALMRLVTGKYAIRRLKNEAS